MIPALSCPDIWENQILMRYLQIKLTGQLIDKALEKFLK